MIDKALSGGAQSVRSMMDALEPRLLLSAAHPSVSLKGGTLRIVEPAGKDSIVVTHDHSRHRDNIVFNVDGHTKAFKNSAVKHVVVNGVNRDDLLALPTLPTTVPTPTTPTPPATPPNNNNNGQGASTGSLTLNNYGGSITTTGVLNVSGGGVLITGAGGTVSASPIVGSGGVSPIPINFSSGGTLTINPVNTGVLTNPVQGLNNLGNTFQNGGSNTGLITLPPSSPVVLGLGGNLSLGLGGVSGSGYTFGGVSLSGASTGLLTFSSSSSLILAPTGQLIVGPIAIPLKITAALDAGGKTSATITLTAAVVTIDKSIDLNGLLAGGNASGATITPVNAAASTPSAADPYKVVLANGLTLVGTYGQLLPLINKLNL